MEAVNESPAPEAPIHSLEAQEDPAVPLDSRPGALTKRGSRKAGSSSPSPTRSAGWNKFGRDAPFAKKPIEISSFSKDDNVRVKESEEERRCVAPLFQNRKWPTFALPFTCIYGLTCQHEVP
jgi:hypothetical protein